MTFLNSFEALNSEILTNNLSCGQALEMGGVWDIYTQDGPCDETMLVREDLNMAILKDDLFGMRPFSGEISNLNQCGWVKIGEADLTEEPENL